MPAPVPESAPLRPPQREPTNTPIGSVEAARRKRERDRECQRRKRERDRRHTARLEERVRQLEGQLGTSPQKKARVERATTDPADECGTDGAWSVPTPSSQGRPDATPGPAATEAQRSRSQSLGSSAPPLSSPAGSSDAASSGTVAVSLQVLAACLAAPQWARLPLHGLTLVSDPRHCVRGIGLQLFITRTRADAGLASLCPPTPKVIDILYGGSRNPLANLVVAGCSGEPLLAPERLATSWALYQYCRWLIWPSAETFQRLPELMHPTAMQLTVEHQWCIDLVVWPELRESMIRNQSTMDIDAAIGLFLCSLRIRGSFNTHFISRHNEGDLEIDSDFLRRFTDPANWGLLQTFWTKYPDLVEGLDPGLKIREKDLLAS